MLILAVIPQNVSHDVMQTLKQPPGTMQNKMGCVPLLFSPTLLHCMSSYAGRIKKLFKVARIHI